MAKRVKRYKRIFEVMNYMIRAEIAAWGNTLWNQKLQYVGAKDFVLLVKNNKVQAYINEEDFIKIPAVGFRNFTNTSFVKKDLQKTDQVLDELCQKIIYLQTVDLKKKDNKELGKLTRDYFNKVKEVYGHFQTSAPWFFYKIEEKIRRYLAGKTKSYVEQENVLRMLARPIKRFVFEQEEIDLLALASKKHDLSLIKLHQKYYEWLNADSNLTSYTLRDVVKKLKELNLVKKSELAKKRKELVNRQKLAIRENRKLLKKYKISPSYQRLFRVLQEYSYKRFYIRFCWTQGMYYGQILYREIAKRSGINLKDVKYCLTDELVDFLLKGKRFNKKELQKRQKGYVIWMKNFKLNLYTGRKADQIAQYVAKHAKIERTTRVKGEIGSPGKIVGKVKVLSYDKPLTPQIEAMKKGEILVAGQTRPEVIAACRKAGAIVTNEGGICSHAAVVSREFKIPCVIGTKIATDIFKDGDQVKVDADQGIVERIDI